MSDHTRPGLYTDVSQLVESPSDTRGVGEFESPHPYYVCVAKRIRHEISNLAFVGSSPTADTGF